MKLCLASYQEPPIIMGHPSPTDKDFFQLFPVILTDNGGGFARVDDIEMDIRGEIKLFFCDPNRS